MRRTTAEWIGVGILIAMLAGWAASVHGQISELEAQLAAQEEELGYREAREQIVRKHCERNGWALYLEPDGRSWVVTPRRDGVSL